MRITVWLMANFLYQPLHPHVVPCPCLYLFMCVHSAKKTNRTREPRLEGTWRSFLTSLKGRPRGGIPLCALFLYIQLAYENIAFPCCIKRTLERRRLVSLFTRSMGEAGHFHRCGTKQRWEERGWLLILSLSCFHH